MEREEKALRGLLGARGAWIQLPGQSCLGIEDAIGFVTGGADGLSRARAVAHLAVCAPCAAEIEALQGIDDEPEIEVPLSLRSRLIGLDASSSSPLLDVAPILPKVLEKKTERKTARTARPERADAPIPTTRPDRAGSARTARPTPPSTVTPTGQPALSPSGRRLRAAVSGRRTGSGSSSGSHRTRATRPTQSFSRVARASQPNPMVPIAAAAVVLLGLGLLFAILGSSTTPVSQPRNEGSTARRELPAQTGPLVADRLDAEPEPTPAPEPTPRPEPTTTVVDPEPSIDPEPTEPEPSFEPEPTSPEPETTPEPALTEPPDNDPPGEPGTTVVREEPTPPPTAERRKVRIARGAGFATRRAGDEKFEPVRKLPIKLTDGTHVKAGRRGAFIELDGKIEVYLDKNVEAIIRKNANGRPEIELADGRVAAEIDRHGGKIVPFAIRTGAAVFACTGTVFGVEANSATVTARLAVAEGEVLCKHERGRQAVQPGFALDVAENKALDLPEKADVRKELLWTRRLRPREVNAYSVAFRDGKKHGWEGTPRGRDDTEGKQPALQGAPTPDAKYWSTATKFKPGSKIFSVKDGTRIKFSLWLEADERVLIQCYNATQGQYFKHHLGDVPGGRWTTFTIPADLLKTYTEPDKNPVKNGDVFTTLEIWSGDPGVDFTLLLSDVRIYDRVE